MTIKDHYAKGNIVPILEWYEKQNRNTEIGKIYKQFIKTVIDYWQYVKQLPRMPFEYRSKKVQTKLGLMQKQYDHIMKLSFEVLKLYSNV